ncbi:PAS domain-containing sensor histidine kinase [Mucilaginibacter pedocola]|uniref:histidine kinase n=1 Tax=Mucilaginibacter pedocola TaxID=1792845 RepID=A0A1S9P6M8_9SPHI|nr:PAS domain-containing sensor histidine kinase [Mucilaginibacter pedocola]OOQ56602.1 hypothetical protein BC343_19425 [Mucilaginibacter pedocola]
MNLLSFDPSVDPELFFNSAQDLFCIAGFDGCFKQVNPAVCFTLGYTAEELFSRPIDTFIHPEDRSATRQKRKALSEGKPLSNFENRYITKSGEAVWLSWTSVANPAQESVFAVAKNITARKIKDIEREAVLNELSAEQQALKELVYTALHDLRSPIGNMASIFNLYGQLKEPSTAYREPLKLLKSSIDDLRHQIDKFLDRLAGHELKNCNRTEVLFSAALDRVKQTLYARINESKAEVISDFTDAVAVSFDQTYLDSIILNLLSNSLKYSRPGVPPVIYLTSRKLDQYIELTITDNGLGMERSVIESRLFRLHQRFHDHQEGKGIGLWLVKKHLDNYGGKISVSSRPGKGTTFRMLFRK